MTAHQSANRNYFVLSLPLRARLVWLVAILLFQTFTKINAEDKDYSGPHPDYGGINFIF